VDIVNLEVLLSLNDRGLVRSNFGPGCQNVPTGYNGTNTQLCDGLAQVAKGCQRAGKKIFISLLAKHRSNGFFDSVGQSMFGDASAALLLAQEFVDAVPGPIFGGEFEPDGINLEVIPDTSSPYRRRAASTASTTSSQSPLLVFLRKVLQLTRSRSPEFYISVSLPCSDPYVLPADAGSAIDFVTIRFNDPSCDINVFSLSGFFATWKRLGGSSMLNRGSISLSHSSGLPMPSMQLGVSLLTSFLPEPTSTITLTSTSTITLTAFVTASHSLTPSERLPIILSSDSDNSASHGSVAGSQSTSSDITSTEILIVSVVDNSNTSNTPSASSGTMPSLSIDLPSILPSVFGEAEFLSAISSFLAAQSRSSQPSLPSQTPILDIQGAGMFTINLLKRTAAGSSSADLPVPTDFPPMPSIPRDSNPSHTFFQITVLSTSSAAAIPLVNSPSPRIASPAPSAHGRNPRPFEFWPSNATNQSNSSTPRSHHSHTTHNHRLPRLLIGLPGAQASSPAALPALSAELHDAADGQRGFGGVAVLGSYPAMEATGAWDALMAVLAGVLGTANGGGCVFDGGAGSLQCVSGSGPA
jgi:hypothetical protein